VRAREREKSETIDDEEPNISVCIHVCVRERRHTSIEHACVCESVYMYVCVRVRE